MLSKAVRKKISEHNLLHYIETDSNPSQTRLRIYRQCNQALKDLTLIAEKSSEKEIDEIFKIGLIQNFLYLLLVLKNSDSMELRPPNTKLGHIFAEYGIDTCLREYKDKHADSPSVTQLIADHLVKASGICSEIGKKTITEYINKKIVNDSGEYICNFEELYSENRTGNFVNYIKKIMKIDTPFFKMEIDPESESLHGHRFTIYDELSIPEADLGTKDEILGSIVIEFNIAKQEGMISFFEKERRKIKSVTFIVEEYFSRKCVIHKK